MIELQDVCFTIQKDGEDINLVNQVSLKVPKGHFMAIVGPSGCGKTTLLKTIAGLNPESAGSLIWEGRNLSEEEDFEPTEIGYVPQFSIAYDPLTVDESIEAATRLRVKTSNASELDRRIDRVLDETGLTAIADRKVKVLSGGQKRRLGLAMELVSDPRLLLCDEVTSGLDPRSEREIVRLLHDLSRKDGRIVMSVTHSLAHLELYDSVLVLHEGSVAFHGPPEQMTHYFSVNDTEEVYPRLASQRGERWMASWNKHHESYGEMMMKKRQKLIASGSLHVPEEPVPENRKDQQEKSAKKADKKAATTKKTMPAEDGSALSEKDRPKPPQETIPLVTKALPLPGFFSQFSTLLSRRWRIFFRDRTQVLLQLAILIIFPIVVTLFVGNLPDSNKRHSEMHADNVVEAITDKIEVKENQAKLGSAASGIIMFQVILLALMGSNNGAREIAGERQVFEKEKFGGLRPSAYIASKVVFLACLVLTQSLYMTFYVELAGYEFSGDLVDLAMFMVMINAAMTAICLAISALMRTAEQASLLSIYLVGFQLPLSGAVLALPQYLEPFVRPFISAYWAWSGSVQAMSDFTKGAVESVIDTSLSLPQTCMAVLAVHCAVALIAAFAGACRPQWD